MGGWTWNGNTWLPDKDALGDPQPPYRGFAVGARCRYDPVDPTDVSIPANRPTVGGMSSGDFRTLASLNGWTLASKDGKKFTCSDKSHSPKGEVYTDGKVFYGADLDGHVGWGFKVWERKKGNELKYCGNTVWTGKAWNYVKRHGT